MRQIGQSIGVFSSSKHTSTGFFENVEPRDVVHLIHTVGRGIGLQLLDPDRPEDLSISSIIGYAADVLLDWPRGLHLVLNQIDTGNKGGVGKRFGSLWVILCGMNSNIPLSVKNLFRQEFFKFFFGVCAADASEKKNACGEEWIRLPEASRRLGMDRSRVKVLAKRHKLLMRIFEHPRAVFIDARDLHKLQQTTNPIFVGPVAKLLGAGRVTAAKIMDAGYLKSNPAEEKVNIPSKAVNGLLAKVACSLYRKKVSREVNFFHTRSFDACALLEKVLSGQLRPCRVDRKAVGLRAYYFDLEDIRRCKDETRKVQDEVCRRTARRIIGATALDLRRLVEFGYLQISDADPMRRNLVFSGVISFCETYGATARLARLYKTDSGTMKRILEKSSCKPLLRAVGPDSRTFWSIQEVGRALARRGVAECAQPEHLCAAVLCRSFP